MATYPRSFACPYCGTILAKRPTRKIACPACQEMIYVRDDLPLTKDQAAEYDLVRHWVAYLPGVQQEDVWKEGTKLTKKWGRPAPIRDAIWAVMNQRVKAERDGWKQAEIYNVMASFLQGEGKDNRAVLKLSEKARKLGQQQTHAAYSYTVSIDDPPSKPAQQGRSCSRTLVGCGTIPVLLLFALILLMLSACGATPSATPTPTQLPTMTATGTATRMPTQTPNPTRTATASATATATSTSSPTLSPTATLTPVPTATPTALPVNTPKPTPNATQTVAAAQAYATGTAIAGAPTRTPVISQPSATPAPAAAGLIVNASAIFDAPVASVEQMLGRSVEVVPMRIGGAEEIPDGGESRTYRVGKYTVWVNYDKKGIAKGIQVVDGLTADGYTLDQWGVILSRIGVGYVGMPDRVAPEARRWTNALGYGIMMTTAKPGGPVWTVRMYKIPK